MAKISGFFLSALLVVFCLWLSVFSFPDVIRPDDLAIVDRASARPAAVDANVELKSSAAAVTVEAAQNASESTEEPSDRSSDASSAPKSESETSSHDVADAANLGYTQTSSAIDVADSDRASSDATENKDALKASGRAQGGKYVSIPSVEMDAFHLPAGAPYTDRVISVTRAVVPQVDPAYN